MGKTQKDQSSYASALRELLQKLARNKLRSREDIADAAKRTTLSKSYIGQMVYQGKGGMDAWAELLFTIYDLTPSQAEGLFHLAVKKIEKGTPSSDSKRNIEKILNSLSEDKLWFWLSLIVAAEGIKPSFRIKKNKT